MPTFEEYVSALRARDVMREMIRDEVERARPIYRIATVVSWDAVERTATVQYPEGGDPVPVDLGSATPTYVGQLVRITGPSADKYVEDIYTPQLMTVRQKLWSKTWTSGTFAPVGVATWEELSTSMRYVFTVDDATETYTVKISSALMGGTAGNRTSFGVWDGVVNTGTNIGCIAFTDTANWVSVSAEKPLNFTVGSHDLRLGVAKGIAGGQLFGDAANYPTLFEVYVDRQVVMATA